MPRSRDASSTARRNDPSCCVSAARKRFPKAMPFSSSLLAVAKRREKSFTSAGAPSARTVSARPPFRRRRAQPAGRLGDLVIRADLDPMSLRRGRDLPPRRLFRAFGLELGLVPARHRVPDVGLVVQRQVALAVLVDVGEGAL